MVPDTQHLGDERRGMLQVGIHDDDCLAAGVVEACEHGILFAKVAGQVHIADPFVLQTEGFQNVQCAVF